MRCGHQVGHGVGRFEAITEIGYEIEPHTPFAIGFQRFFAEVGGHLDSR